MTREQLLLDRLLADTHALFGDDLVGLYVHGSLAFGCFRWETSDLDVLVVTRSAPSPAQKESFLSLLLDHDRQGPGKGLELSLVLEKDCRFFRHPCPYYFHFSRGHLAAAQADPVGFIRRMAGVDHDLAAHFTVTRAVGISLYGPPPAQLFAPVPRADYLDSILRDVEDAREGLVRDPVYFLLNLCRVLAACREGAVLSKEQGGQWALPYLPDSLRPAVEEALVCYRTGRPFSLPLQEDTARTFLDLIKKSTP